jgi:integrase
MGDNFGAMPYTDGVRNGANLMDLAEQTGHDKRVLLSTYAHAINNQSLIVEF